MAPTKVILLACGSFNPITNMHLRMFEIARDHLHRMGHSVVIGGLISPVHDGYGKKDLEPASHRLNMVKLAISTNDWVKLSDWECRQETWSKTRQVLQYHQNHVNELLHPSRNHKSSDDNTSWIPDNIENDSLAPVQVKLLCGADLLESFGTPGLWSNDDIESIVGQHGLIVITRSMTNPNEFIYNSDVLTKYMSNITIVTEWIQNEVSSTKIRRSLRRSESVRYLIPDKVIEYIHKHNLYGSKLTKYLSPEYNSNFLTPSPSDTSPSPTNCMIICNNTLFNRNCDKQMSIDTVDSGLVKGGALKHPGQAVKVITDSSGGHKVVKEVGTGGSSRLKHSISCAGLINESLDQRTTATLKECKSCDENLVKFIFTRHGISSSTCMPSLVDISLWFINESQTLKKMIVLRVIK